VVKRKILRLTTSLTIYRLGLRGNSVLKSTRKHRFWTKKPLKSPEITQKIFAGHFGTLRSWVRSPSPRPKIRWNLTVAPYFFVICDGCCMKSCITMVSHDKRPKKRRSIFFLFLSARENSALRADALRLIQEKNLAKRKKYVIIK